VTIPGRDNTVGMPIYLLPIDTPRGLLVDDTHGGTLTLDELAGFALTVVPGAATFPEGGKRGTVSVTLVHNDKVPMVPNFGQQPRFIVTIQPAGTHFNPPAALTMPNVEGLAPGQKTEMYSFDHDLGAFVSIGPATVSEDGMVVQSDPGVGVVKGGWHGGGGPTPPGHTKHFLNLHILDANDPQTRIMADDVRTDDDALNKLLIWYDQNAEGKIKIKVGLASASDNHKDDTITYKALVKFFPPPSAELVTGTLAKEATGEQLLEVPQNNLGADYQLQYGVDVNNDGKLSSDEVSKSYEIYGITPDEYKTAKNAWGTIARVPNMGNFNGVVFGHFFTGVWDTSEEAQQYLPSRIGTIPLTGTVRIKGTIKATTDAEALLTHKCGVRLSPSELTKISENDNLVGPRTPATVALYEYFANSATTTLLGRDPVFNNEFFQFLSEQARSPAFHALIQQAYDAAGGGPPAQPGETRQVSFPIDTVFDLSFFPTQIALGKVGVVGNVTVQVEETGRSEEKRDFAITGPPIMTGTVEDRFDFDYFGTGRLDFLQQQRFFGMTAVQVAAQVQCGFGKSRVTANAGEVAVIRIALENQRISFLNLWIPIPILAP
jgi:hypothetical protein